MTKKEVEEKIKEILLKDKKYISVKLSITYKDKNKSIQR